MNVEFDWAKYVDENSSASMQSADFSELPLAKLDWESSRGLEIDHSREGLSLELANVLKVESNSNFSRSSLKRSRCHSPDISTSNAKRIKLERVPGFSPHSGAKSSLEKQQINFAEILKATKERQKKRQERVDLSSSLNTHKVTAAERGNIISHVGSSGGGAAGTPRRKTKLLTKEEIAAQPPQTTVFANFNTQGCAHSNENKMVPTSCQTSKSNERNNYLGRPFLKKLESESGRSIAPIQTTSCQQPGHVIWQMQRKSDISAANSTYSPDLMADKTTKTFTMNQDSESETNAPSISSLSSNRTHMQSNESMSMATSESDMNALFALGSSSPSPFVSRSEPEATYSPTYSLRSEKGKKSRSIRKTRYTNARGEVIILTKHQIDMRFRQLSIGKQTWGYQNYIRAVSKSMRSSWHPKTPDAMERISKRRFNGKVNVWRRKLHFWDAPRSESRARESHEARMGAQITQDMQKYIDYENEDQQGFGWEN